MFYSAKTNGFYDFEIHGTNMPPDVVEITKEYHYFLINSQCEGKIITSDSFGYPISIDRPIDESFIQNEINSDQNLHLIIKNMQDKIEFLENELSTIKNTSN